MALISGSSKTEIVSQAFSAIGAPRPVNDLDENPTTSAAARRYDTILLNMLSLHNWRFATVTAALNKLAASPLPRQWQNAYQLPTQYLTAFRIRPNLEFEIFGEQIYINYDNASTPLILDYLAKVPEGQFPGYFVELMIKVLASELAMPVAQNVNLLQILKQEAGQQLNIARSTDSKAYPNAPVQKDALLRAHGGSSSFIGSR